MRWRIDGRGLRRDRFPFCRGVNERDANRHKNEESSKRDGKLFEHSSVPAFGHAVLHAEGAAIVGVLRTGPNDAT